MKQPQTQPKREETSTRGVVFAGLPHLRDLTVSTNLSRRPSRRARRNRQRRGALLARTPRQSGGRVRFGAGCGAGAKTTAKARNCRRDSSRVRVRTFPAAGMDPSPPALSRQLTSHLDAMGESFAPPPDASGAGPASHMGAGAGDEGAAVLQAPKYPGAQLQARLGVATDIGGGQVNQDEGGFLELEGGNVIVLAVFDGHGRELGELAAQVAKQSVFAALKRPEVLAELRVSPKAVFVRLFAEAHDHIRKAFSDKYVAAGWEVAVTPEGYLTKRQGPNSPWSCTHGGTTATVCVLLDKWRLVVANVGDSTALWGGIGETGEPVYKELSAEHSPEAPSEFRRVRAFRPSPQSPTLPEMRFVYDAPSFSKNQCPSVFQVSCSCCCLLHTV